MKSDRRTSLSRPIETLTRVYKHEVSTSTIEVGTAARNKLPWLVKMVAPQTLKRAKRNARTHSKKQIHLVAQSITRYGVINPVVIDCHGNVIAGHARLEACLQAKLDGQLNNHNVARVKSKALLAGRIFDDRGNRMSHSHARKRGVKYRYYLSAALTQGRAEQAGSIFRVPAAEIEALVIKSVREHLKPTVSLDDRSLVNAHVVRVEIQADQLIIQLNQAQKQDHKRAGSKGRLLVAWQKPPSKRRREILLPNTASPNGQTARPIRSVTRATLVASIARGRRWLDELISDPSANAETIAAREKCSMRTVNMMISLAFLAPHLVKAAIEGKLPHGMGVVRLCDLPAEWSRQNQMLGLLPQ